MTTVPSTRTLATINVLIPASFALTYLNGVRTCQTQGEGDLVHRVDRGRRSGRDHSHNNESSRVRLIHWILVRSLILCFSWFPVAREVYYTHQKSIGIWVPPPAPQYRPNRNAIITFVWTANDTIPAAVLGHSISRWTPAIYEEGGITAERCATVDMLLMHLPEAVDEESRRQLEQVGWKLVPVERVHGPKDIPKDRR